MAFSKKLYIFVLTIIFAYNIFRSYLNVLEEPTTFEESNLKYSASFPSVTFCIRLNGKDNYTTFNDLKKDVEQFKGFFKSDYKIYGKGVKEENLKLNDPSVLSKRFNTTLDYIWESSAMVLPEWDYSIVPCLTLNPPVVPSPRRGRHHLKTIIGIPKGRKYVGLYVLKHEYKQSTHTYDMDISTSYQALQKSRMMEEYLTQTQTIYLKKNRHDCLEDNSMYFKDCMDEFIGQQLKCDLPWASNRIEDEECTTEEALKLFRNLSMNMESEDVRAKIQKKGCFLENCKETTWIKNPYEYGRGDKKMVFLMHLPSNTKVLERKEVHIATFNTFVADFGGYLGLFLGASILSLTDSVLSYIKRGLQWFVYRK